MKPIVKHAVVNSLLATLYIALVSLFLSYAPSVFGPAQKDTVLVPIVMLSLLVFSVAIMGVLIFGRSAMWYLDGRKDEALSLLAHTLAIFFFIIIVALLALFILSSR
ncbi:MAG: hypothetical protein A2946_02720 [Candidatus Liptonbacteria bacterium RIFCSPLOWO2_01_FULL_53_13]|uniref:Uncharacterized protein n=1 Tax=Candidatus Liptonbacteria bacterium RIFCSPLOWO2_01_FULL_53_13 TaxID=1798651 RepID=A0A1G2CNV9_9BACT|nr:MAG: hypothetical protein A2946_02720 [Candidatus Liptonbacteria bacterium RIFCSPLOWO2_01_FULL_53_13]